MIELVGLKPIHDAGWTGLQPGFIENTKDLGNVVVSNNSE
jgi:hypothetical protein